VHHLNETLLVGRWSVDCGNVDFFVDLLKLFLGEGDYLSSFPTLRKTILQILSDAGADGQADPLRVSQFDGVILGFRHDGLSSIHPRDSCPVILRGFSGRGNARRKMLSFLLHTEAKGKTMKTREITCEIESETIHIQIGENRHSFSREEADELYSRINESFWESDEEVDLKGIKMNGEEAYRLLEVMEEAGREVCWGGLRN